MADSREEPSDGENPSPVARTIASSDSISSGEDENNTESRESVVEEQERINNAFLSHLQSTRSLSSAIALDPDSLQSSQSTTPTTQPPASAPALSLDTAAHAWNTGTTNVTTAVASADRQSVPRNNQSSSPESNAEDAVVPCVPSQVLPTTLEDNVSGLTSATVPLLSNDDFLGHIHHHDNQSTSTFHLMDHSPPLGSRTITSSTISTTATVTAPNNLESGGESKLQELEDLVLVKQQQAIGLPLLKETTDADNQTEYRTQQRRLEEDLTRQQQPHTVDYATQQRHLEEKLNRQQEGDFETQQRLLEEKVVQQQQQDNDFGTQQRLLEEKLTARSDCAAQHGRLEEKLTRQQQAQTDYRTQQRELEEKLIQQQSRADYRTQQRELEEKLIQQQAQTDYATQQRELEEKLMEQQTQREAEATPTPQSQQAAFSVALEPFIVEELEALNRSEDVAAILVRPGAYHQEPGRAAILRAQTSVELDQVHTHNHAAPNGQPSEADTHLPAESVLEVLTLAPSIIGTSNATQPQQDGTSPPRTPNSESDQEVGSNSGLVQAHPVHPSNIVSADPMGASEQRRTRTYPTSRNEDANERNNKVNRQMVILPLVFLCLAVSAGVVVLTTVVVLGKSVTPLEENAAAHTAIFLPTTKRGIQIQKQLREEHGIDTDDNDIAHHSAMDWLVNVDAMALDPWSDNLLQRYLMAYFYFHTSQQGPWVSCNPKEEETKFCSYRYVKPFGFESYEESPWHIRWLSGEDHECEWAGIYCDESNSVNEVSLNGYNLTGRFPTQIAKLRTITILSLRDNQLRGSLPSELSAMTNLQILRMNQNSFTGSIPTSWAVLTLMRNVDVANNALTGTLPEHGIFSLTNLENLWLNHNLFTGTIPSAVSRLSKLRQMFLNNNDFCGPLPDVGNLAQLEYLDLSSNIITGSLPQNIGQLKRLKDLVLSSTSLDGTIPDELYGLPDLQDLILSGCNFTGTVGTRIGRLLALQNLLLQDNEFSGTLPTELGKLESLMSVQVQHNQFEGFVPDAMCLLKGPNTLTKVIADCTTVGETSRARVHCADGCCTSCCDANTGICDSN